MPSQGPLSPSTVADDSGVGTETWSNPTNATASDDSRATVTVDSLNTTSHYLKATNFGFSIPAGSTINGIVVEWEKSKSGAGDCVDNRVRIVKGGTIGSTDRADGSAWGTGDAYTSYGSSSDLWGETWTASDINGSGFGTALSVIETSGTPSARIDHVRITVHYTTASGSALMMLYTQL